MVKDKPKDSFKTSRIIDPAGTTLYEEIYDLERGETYFVDMEGYPHDSLQIGDILYEPIPPDDPALIEKAVILPTQLLEYDNLETLNRDIKVHIHKYCDISRDFEYITSWYIQLSWVYDRCNTIPYLRALGDSGTGKTRFLEVAGRLCYKPMIMSGAINPAPIYRMIRKWGGTMILDEADIRMSDEKNEVVKILNCGFERGRPVLRCQQNNVDNIQVLPTFCPKVFATRKRFDDTALESRCLTEIMKETNRDDIPILLPSSFYEEEMELRNKLIMYRLKNWGKIQPDSAQGLYLGEIESRLKQTMSPFAVLFSSLDDAMKIFMEFLNRCNRDLVEERSQSFDGWIVNAIHDLSTIDNVTLDTAVTPNHVITPGDIAKYLFVKHNLDKSISPQKIGKHIKILGLETELKRVDGESKRVIKCVQPKLDRLFKRYVVPGDTSDTSVTNVSGHVETKIEQFDEKIMDSIGTDIAKIMLMINNRDK